MLDTEREEKETEKCANCRHHSENQYEVSSSQIVW